MNERSGTASQDYVLVPAASIDEKRLLAFDATVRPGRQPADRILASWWRRAAPECAVAAIHGPSEAMVGICGGRPSTWILASRTTPTVAICEWFVDPAHAGKGIGKRMVQHFSAPDRYLYTFVISDAAIANFKRLGWVGPYVAPMLLCPAPGLAALRFGKVRCGIEFQDYVVAGRDVPAPLATALDRIEANRGVRALAHMMRGAQELSWRLSLGAERSYRFSVACRASEPVGYVAVRRTTPGTNRLMDRLRAAIVSDLVAIADDVTVLRALARRAAASAGALGAAVALATTTVAAQRNALTGTGFLSPNFPLLGRLLEPRSPRFMWVPEGPAAHLTADGMALTFADSDADLNL